MMSMLQMLSYATLINLHYPSNLLIFFDCLESVHNFNKWMPNVFSYIFRLSELDLQPFNEQYEARGFPNRNLLLLCGPDLMVFVGLLLLLAFVIPLAKACSYLRLNPLASLPSSRRASATACCTGPSSSPICACV